jgi:soluble lytic murein transglycosylase
MFYAIHIKKIKRIFFALFAVVFLCTAAYLAISWYYPLKYLPLIEQNSRKYNLDPALVCAVIHTESRFNDDALSNKGASGLMQILRTTADWASQEIGLSGYSYDRIFEPETNIEIGCWLLNRLHAQFGGTEKALAAYNAGSGNVTKWLGNEAYSSDGETLEVIPFAETARYVEKVRFNQKVYEVILRIWH